MSSLPAAPASTLDQTVHFVLCDYGWRGMAYAEADPDQGEQAVVHAIASGEHECPLHVIACNAAEGWCRDVSERIAQRLAAIDPDDLADGALEFMQRHGERALVSPLE
ncbi:MAG: hypothetical protein C5B46_02360 [Proteobacteria bacterium]|nr:MAG: hypothetical protein C5B46_02360 [Pseudomonadota bacterium]